MADWYVYQHDGDPLGPWSTDTVADAILGGKLAPDVWVAAPGGPRWLRALDVPVIGRLASGIPTKPRRDSGLRLMPGAFKNRAIDLPEEDDAPRPASVTLPSADATLKMYASPARAIETHEDVMAFAADDDRATDPSIQIPPSSSSRTPPIEADRPQRRKSG